MADEAAGDARDLLTDAPCGLVTFADDGTILWINATFLGMLGYTPDASQEVLGRHLAAFLSPAARVFYSTHFFPLLKLHGMANEIYLALRAPDAGDDLPVLVNAVRREGDGAPYNVCALVAMRQRSLFEDEILRARRAAEDASRAKEQAYAALAQVNKELERANRELEAQQQKSLELNAQLLARAERETLLNRIGRALRGDATAPHSEAAALETVAAILGEALAADRCYFVEYHLARDQARVSAEWHQPDLPPLHGTYRISDFDLDLAEVYGLSGLLRTRDVSENGTNGGSEVFSPRAATALKALGVRSQVSVALFDNGAPIAALNIAMADTGRAWTEDETSLVQEVATLTRAAVEEARLREREHRIAELLQEALLPTVPPDVPGLRIAPYYLPALNEASVGGDYYDVFALDECCYALVVADLSGKGLAAAAQIATVRHMLRALLYQRGRTLSRAVTTLNEMLTGHDLVTGFATLFVGEYDATRRTLTYVNAGQEPGLLWRAAVSSVGPDVEKLSPTGPVLGGFAGAAFGEQTIPLTPGDVLALFTDGLTEAGPNRQDQIGVEGMAQILRESIGRSTPGAGRSRGPEETTARIMQAVEVMSVPMGIRDDVCLLVARVE